MTVIVETYSEDDEKDLIAYLKGRNLIFRTETEVTLSDEQKAMISQRERNLSNGLSEVENWDDIKANLLSVYR